MPSGDDRLRTFRAVLCGVDGSTASLVAVRQALALGAEDAKYWAVAAWDAGPAVHAGLRMFEVTRELRGAARAALRRAQELSPTITPVMIRGSEVPALLAGVANLQPDLVAVGSHGLSRAAGVLFGSVASGMAHYAPCSVLIAREPEVGPFPGVIVHADDGSPDAQDAALVAATLAARHGSTLVTVRVGDVQSRSVAEQAVALMETTGVQPVMRVEHGPAHRRLVEIANEHQAGLIVMGSRGLTGLAALGSVSERVAHRAACSALIVRRPAHPVLEDAALEPA